MVLTEPAAWSAAQRRRRGAIRAIGPFLPRAVRPPVPERAGGHYAVTRSVLAGLRRLKVPHLYNPNLDGLQVEAAVVLSSPSAVERAIAWKAAGGCKLLLAGPNIAVLPSDDGAVLRSASVDRVIVPSKWVGAVYAKEAPEIGKRIMVHAAGVDETYWSPWSIRSRRKTALIYNKGMPEFADRIAQSMEQWRIPCQIVNYGAYALQQYRRALDNASACVFLSESESQGIALAEAWAMDVPTLVLHRDERVINGRNMRVSTAPYLGSLTGRFWSTLEELRTLLTEIDQGDYAPREWVLENMTDRISAQQLLNIMSRSDG